MADALSYKTRCSLAFLAMNEWELMRVLSEFGLDCVEEGSRATLYTIEIQPTLITRVIETQYGDEESEVYRIRMTSKRVSRVGPFPMTGVSGSRVDFLFQSRFVRRYCGSHIIRD